jgi:ATP-dependent 26S proteasome regulatory subunit
VSGCCSPGPPGCGKSLVGDFLVGEVRRRGGKALYRTASHYLVKWVGEGAAALRADFALLEAAHAETGVRPLLVVDELEAIALDRMHAWTLNGGHLDVLDTLLGVLTRSSVRMIGISNLADRHLDAALVRDGRLPIVRFPATLGPDGVAALVANCLAHVPLAGEPR